MFIETVADVTELGQAWRQEKLLIRGARHLELAASGMRRNARMSRAAGAFGAARTAARLAGHLTVEAASLHADAAASMRASIKLHGW